MASKGKISEIVDIEAVKAQLKVLNDGVSLAATNIEKVTGEAIKLNASFKDAKGIKELTDNYVKLNKVQNDNAIAQEKLKQQTIATEKAQITLDNAIKKQNQTNQNQQSEYKKLSSQLNDARNAAKDLAAQYGINDKRAREAAAGVQFLDKKVKDIDASVGQHNRNVGNYGDSLKGVGTKILGFASAIGIGIGAMDIFRKVIGSVQPITDAFEATMGGLSEVSNYFARSIASTDFKFIVGGFKEAYEAGKQYAAALDEIQDKQIALNLQKKDIEYEITMQKVIAKDRRKDLTERMAAIDEIIRLEKTKFTKTKTLSDEALAADLQLASKRSGLSKETLSKLITNYELYSKKLDDGYKLHQSLIAQSTIDVTNSYGTTSTFIPKTYQKLLGALTNTQKGYITLAVGYNQIDDEFRKKIEGTLGASKDANQEYADGMLGISKLRNSLTKELIGEEEKNQKQNELFQKREHLSKIETVKIIEANNKQIIQDEANRLTSEHTIYSEKRTEGLDLLKKYNDIEEEEVKANEARKQAIREASFNGARDIFGALGQLSQIGFDKDLALIDEKSKADEAAKQKELDAAGNNQALKDKINAKYEAKEKQHEKERKKIEAEKAKANKETAIFNIILDTARAIVGHLMQPWMIPFDVLTGGLQLAVAQAVQIPKYKHGRKGGYGEFAVVGDGGTEGIQLETGERYLTPNKDTLTYLPQGASVIPNYELFKNSAFENIPEFNNTFNMDLQQLGSKIEGLQSGFVMVANTIQNKKETHFYWDNGQLRMAIKNGSSITEYINNRLHN